VFPQRQLVLVAKQTATLDYLSSGRLILGVGAGWNEAEFGFLGADFQTRGKRLDEYIRALRELWTSPDPRFEGQFVRFSEVLFSPRPVQQAGPPIVIGGGSKAALRRTAELADGWHPVGVLPDRFAEGMQRIRELAHGRSIEGTVRLRTAVGRVLPAARGGDGRPQATLSGSPDQVLARIEEYREGGLNHLVAHFQEDDRAATIEQMRRFAELARR
jgi:probable F420-dependent oxidoreductase